MTTPPPERLAEIRAKLDLMKIDYHTYYPGMETDLAFLLTLLASMQAERDDHFKKAAHWHARMLVEQSDKVRLEAALARAEAVVEAAEKLLQSDAHQVGCASTGQCNCDVRFKLSGARGELVSVLTTFHTGRGGGG